MNSSNYDAQELAKFSKMAAHWWDPHGDLKTLHDINPLRLNYILQKTPLAGKDVIDVGCGGGILSESMALQGANVTGIDLNKALIQVAKLHQLETKTKVTYQVIAAEDIAAEKPAQFDIVTCFELLEHVPDPGAIVSACARLVKPNGHVFFSTLNRNAKSYLFAILGAEYVLKLLPKNTHDYAKFIKPSELNRACITAGIHAKEIKGIRYNPFSKQFSVCDDISVNYLFYGQKTE